MAFAIRTKVKGSPCPIEGDRATLGEYYLSSGVKGDDIPKEMMGVGGYLLKWEDGNCTWIDETSFAAMYEVVTVPKKELFDFGEALTRIRAGFKVARQGWNGKNMFIYLVVGSTIDSRALRASAKEALTGTDLSDKIHINGHIDMRAADGSIVVGWLASQADILSCDWYVV